MTRVIPAADFLGTSQVVVDTTGTTQIVPARSSRAAVMLTMVSAIDVFLGAASGVTTANGDLLAGIKGTSVTIPYNGAIFGIAASATSTVSVLEIF